MNLATVEVLPNPGELARRAAQIFVESAEEAQRRSGRFAAALAGGTTPRLAYRTLAAAPFCESVNWQGVHLFWGDERCVAPDDGDSNFRMVHEALLSHVAIPAENIHRIRGEMTAVQAAEAYQAELECFFGTESVPRFDLIFLGLGEDGHTASLFPGSAALEEESRWVVAVLHDTPPPPLVERISLTLPVLNAAAKVVFLVAGRAKAEILCRALRPPGKEALPAQRIQPQQGSVLWLVDAEAASLL